MSTAIATNDGDLIAAPSAGAGSDARTPTRDESLVKAGRWDVLFMVCSGAFLLLGGMVAKWWRLVEMNEPKFILAMRAGVGLAGMIVLLSLLARRFGPRPALWAGLAGLILPLALMAEITLHNPAASQGAIRENAEARSLIHELTFTDMNPYVAWSDQKTMMTERLLTNDYTFIDGFEAETYFCKVGWYLSLLGGFCLVLGAWMWDKKAVSASVRRYVPWVALGGVLSLAYISFPLVLAHYYWNKGHAASAQGDYALALHYNQKAEKWDPRFAWDVQYHYELGRLYGQLGMTDKQDYWATVADSYMYAHASGKAYVIYTEHVTNPNETPALAARYQNAMLFVGTNNYNAGLRALALKQFQEALKVNPTNVQLLYGLGFAYAGTGDYQRSAAVWKHLINLNESVGLFKNRYMVSLNYRKMITARAWKNLAWCYYKMGRDDLAAQCDQNSDQTSKTSLAILTDEGSAE